MAVIREDYSRDLAPKIYDTRYVHYRFSASPRMQLVCGMTLEVDTLKAVGSQCVSHSISKCALFSSHLFYFSLHCIAARSN